MNKWRSQCNHAAVLLVSFGFYLVILNMGYHGKWDERLRAQELRKYGLSYGEILQHIRVSKGTLSLWCKDVELTFEQKARLMSNKRFGQKKGSIIAADNKRRARIENTKAIFKKATLEIGYLTKRERFFIGISLYAGEGNKSQNSTGFANSNPYLIKFMIGWFREFCRVPSAKFRGAIWIHEELDSGKAKKYWSELTGIPQNQFHKTYIAKDKVDSKKIRKNIHQFGIFTIRFSDVQKQRMILGWISATFGDKIQPAV